MAYTAGLQMLMDNLKKLIHGNHHPLIEKNPMILSERPQFQLLYQEFASIIQTLSNIHQHHHHQHHELEKVRNLKKRFKDVAEEAEDIIDLYLSAVTVDFRNKGFSPRSDVFKTTLDLKNVMRSIDSIKVEFMTININNMKMDSSPRIDSLKTPYAGDAVGTSTSNTRTHLGTRKPLEEIVVGLEHDAEIIRDKLTEDTKQLGVVSIVGMGGLGKTTLATKVFNDRFVVYHFHIRAWITVSQTYTKRDLLIQILTSIGVQQSLDEASDSQLREKLHKKIMGRRYLIVIDDIWTIEAWDELTSFFPHEKTGSRILLTSRLNEVALHVKQHGFVHSLPCLTEEESWELLKHKVFHGDECPEWLIEPGRQIARKCHGLPLSVVVMAGVLAEESMNKDLWEEIACSIGSYHKGNLETLALSYHHLPDHLRECFLYLGGFPEDFGFVVERLIWLWVAEGFIEEAENRSLEDTAKAYLMDLINRNLVIVAKRNVIGDVKACKLHDLVRELCLETLELIGSGSRRNHIWFPNLQVLKLGGKAFMGTKWDACEQQFRQLKLLTFQNLYIKHWEASSTSFPCLKRLALRHCQDLEEIPLEIGEIATLELIEIHNSSNTVVESVKKIQQEQHDVGNDELKITISGMDLSFYLSQHEGSESE